MYEINRNYVPRFPDLSFTSNVHELIAGHAMCPASHVERVSSVHVKLHQCQAAMTDW